MGFGFLDNKHLVFTNLLSGLNYQQCSFHVSFALYQHTPSIQQHAVLKSKTTHSIPS